MLIEEVIAKQCDAVQSMGVPNPINFNKHKILIFNAYK